MSGENKHVTCHFQKTLRAELHIALFFWKTILLCCVFGHWGTNPDELRHLTLIKEVMKYWQPLGKNKLKHVSRSDRNDGKTMSTNVLMPSSVGPMMGLLEWPWVWARISWFWACTWARTIAFSVPDKSWTPKFELVDWVLQWLSITCCVILHLYNEPKISLCKVLPERGESTKSSKWSFESLLASLSRWIGMSPWCLYWISNYSHGDAAAGTCNVVHVSEVVVWNWFAGRTTWLATCWSRTRPWPLWFSLCFTLPLMLGLLGVLKFCFLKHSCVATVTASWIQSEKRNRAMSHVDIRCPPHRPSWPAG